MTLAVMGYHFQIMTQKLTEAVDSLALSPAKTKGLSTEDGEQAG